MTSNPRAAGPGRLVSGRVLWAFRFPRIEPRGVLGRRAALKFGVLTRLGGIRDNSTLGVGRGCLRGCASPIS
jgi:hypothetical protein